MQPQNTNFLQSTKFVMTFSRIPNVQYFCQSVRLPGLSLDAMEQQTPFVVVKRPGDKVTFDRLVIDFLLDEDLNSWKEIYNWIIGMTFPENFDQYKNLKNLSTYSQYQTQPQYADGTLNILTALNNVNLRYEFTGLFPVRLSEVVFNSTDENTTTLTASAEFEYTYYKPVTI